MRSDSLPEGETVQSEPLAVHAACHARISFNIVSPRGAELIVEHWNAEKLLARETRPLTAGASTLGIKTHPEASQITCSLRTEGVPIENVRFNVECGQLIEPTARNFIVIGAMKAGTTTLFELLVQHPALCPTWAQLPDVSFRKEINYFRRLYRNGNSPLHYDWRFPFDAGKHAWTLDVSPSYAQWPKSKFVPERIRSLGGETKLAYILREPLERIESHVAHTLRAGRKVRNLQHYIDTSRYGLQLDQFVAHIDRDDILLLDFEQLRRNPVAILAQICDFLNIEHIAARSVVHNRRSIKFRLEARQRKDIAEVLRPDVQHLISVYGFHPAKKWLRRSVLNTIMDSTFRR